KEEYFNEGPPRTIFSFLLKHPEFKGEPQVAKELQQIADYSKILVLQFEELYQDLDPQDLEEQALQLKHRLIERYVKTQKKQLVEKMRETASEAEIQKLIRKVDKLNALIR